MLIARALRRHGNLSGPTATVADVSVFGRPTRDRRVPRPFSKLSDARHDSLPKEALPSVAFGPEASGRRIVAHAVPSIALILLAYYLIAHGPLAGGFIFINLSTHELTRLGPAAELRHASMFVLAGLMSAALCFLMIPFLSQGQAIFSLLVFSIVAVLLSVSRIPTAFGVRMLETIALATATFAITFRWLRLPAPQSIAMSWLSAASLSTYTAPYATVVRNPHSHLVVGEVLSLSLVMAILAACVGVGFLSTKAGAAARTASKPRRHLPLDLSVAVVTLALVWFGSLRHGGMLPASVIIRTLLESLLSAAAGMLLGLLVSIIIAPRGFPERLSWVPASMAYVLLLSGRLVIPGRLLHLHSQLLLYTRTGDLRWLLSVPVALCVTVVLVLSARLRWTQAAIFVLSATWTSIILLQQTAMIRMTSAMSPPGAATWSACIAVWLIFVALGGGSRWLTGRSSAHP